MGIFSGIRLVCLRICIPFGLRVDNRAPGNESIAVVEFAPFQKVPNEKKKADTRAGTIEKGALFDLHQNECICLTPAQTKITSHLSSH